MTNVYAHTKIHPGIISDSHNITEGASIFLKTVLSLTTVHWNKLTINQSNNLRVCKFWISRIFKQLPCSLGKFIIFTLLLVLICPRKKINNDTRLIPSHFCQKRNTNIIILIVSIFNSVMFFKTCYSKISTYPTPEELSSPIESDECP